MAGDWIPIFTDLTRKREVLVLASRTKLSRRAVVGTLVEFWSWAQEQTDDGFIDGVDVKALDWVIPGTSESFWSTLQEVGWLTETPTGIRIPNAENWLSRGAKARLGEALRKQLTRSGDRHSTSTDPGCLDKEVQHRGKPKGDPELAAQSCCPDVCPDKCPDVCPDKTRHVSGNCLDYSTVQKSTYEDQKNPPFSSPLAGGLSPPKKKQRALAVTWPEGGSLDADLRQYAVARGVPEARVADVWEHFESYHRAKGSKFSDWRAAWRTWVLRERQYVAPAPVGVNGSTYQTAGEKQSAASRELLRRAAQREAEMRERGEL